VKWLGAMPTDVLEGSFLASAPQLFVPFSSDKSSDVYHDSTGAAVLVRLLVHAAPDLLERSCVLESFLRRGSATKFEPGGHVAYIFTFRQLATPHSAAKALTFFCNALLPALATGKPALEKSQKDARLTFLFQLLGQLEYAIRAGQPALVHMTPEALTSLLELKDKTWVASRTSMMPALEKVMHSAWINGGDAKDYVRPLCGALSRSKGADASACIARVLAAACISDPGPESAGLKESFEILQEALSQEDEEAMVQGFASTKWDYLGTTMCSAHMGLGHQVAIAKAVAAWVDTVSGDDAAVAQLKAKANAAKSKAQVGWSCGGFVVPLLIAAVGIAGSVYVSEKGLM